MAWRFRLGSRREENGGTGVQVAEALPEEASQNVAAEEAVASVSTSESAAEASEPTTTAESPGLSVVTEETHKNESTETAEKPESQIPDNNVAVTQATDAPATSDSSAETTQSLLADATAPLAPAFPAIASDWAFEEKLAMHKEWVESQGISGKKIDLASAKLEGAELVGVNLRYADLQEADLKAADLLLADLRDTCLARANLEETCLVGANLEGANMEGAALASAMGLVPRQIAGANLRDATLPPQILEFPGLADFARASRTVMSFFTA
ncbi:MAG: pentapeptide repeat-containing protein, partial [Candidatus Acidiferrales bacterium]